MKINVGIDVGPQRGLLNSPVNATYFWLDVIWIKLNKVYQNANDKLFTMINNTTTLRLESYVGTFYTFHNVFTDSLFHDLLFIFVNVTTAQECQVGIWQTKHTFQLRAILSIRI